MLPKLTLPVTKKLLLIVRGPVLVSALEPEVKKEEGLPPGGTSVGPNQSARKAFTFSIKRPHPITKEGYGKRNMVFIFCHSLKLTNHNGIIIQQIV